jgi:hypothetical protein
VLNIQLLHAKFTSKVDAGAGADILDRFVKIVFLLKTATT